MRARVPAVRTAVPAVVGVAVLAVAADLAAHQPAPVPAPVATVVVTDSATSGTGVGGGAGGGEVPWWLLVIVLALVLVAAAVLWFVFRDGAAMLGGRRAADELRLREGEADRRTAELTALAEAALADASADLDAGGDPREVVIACWVRIERAAEELGQGRRPAETATDVARRWLAGSPDRTAVDDLAGLYHLARYSSHPLTEAHRDRARAALRGVVGAPA